jgi:ATP-dependent helicase/nuclease subunit A
VNAKTVILPDATDRERALEPDGSFIVQAPAGSGKTELLIQRYLSLLAVVDEPEEIIAITFTRKAATEMRTRILKVLAHARAGEPPPEAHLHTGYELARRALKRDRDRDWGVHEQPSRMRIGTIDSVNARIARRAPISAGFTCMNELVEHTQPIYCAAARETIGMAADGGEFGERLQQLLALFDNRADRLESLLAAMLARRDQWMRVTGAGLTQDLPGLRVELETALAELVRSPLGAADSMLIEDCRREIFEVLTYAGCSITIENPESPLAAWQDAEGFPQASVANLALWRSMASAFLTGKGEWRKKLDKRQGFPPDGKDMKARAMELIGALGEIPDLEQALEDVRLLPDPFYSEEQWEMLSVLLTALPLAAANLKREFAINRQTDYTEIAQEALAALGNEDEPTELGLALDYQVRHILLDEFQDTSRSQFDLLRKLTAGWQPGSGRTLFLVGDPMQSIYRFREAEVGLFVEAKDHGIGEVQLESLTLQANFRSDPALVGWFNALFEAIDPPVEDASTGTVRFAPGLATHDPDPDAGVSWHAVPYREDEFEAGQVVDLVRDSLSHWPADSIGILVRSRRHGVEVERALRTANIAVSGAGLETLEQQAVVQDLLALTRAMTHRGDRLAWLSVLRAPWCGLSLADLASIACDDLKACPWDIIRNSELPALSAEGRKRLANLRPVIERNLERYPSVPLRDCIEQAWLKLGGPATVAEESELELADRYFEFLDVMELGGDCNDNSALLTRLREFSKADPKSGARVQVMTMHKAKGLEFDTVILPGLGYPTKRSDRPILLWDEVPGADQAGTLVVAPMNPARQKNEGIYELLWRMEQGMEARELDRLLYVSVTRARKRLRLFAPLKKEKDGPGPAEPARGSLLERIWPVVSDQIVVETGIELPVSERADAWRKSGDWFEVAFPKVPADWARPAAPPAIAGLEYSVDAFEPEEPEFEWASPWARHAGSVVHQWLQRIAEDGSERYDRDRIEGMRTEFRRALRRMGTESESLDGAVDRVVDALAGALEDERGRWILSGHHAESTNEWPVSSGTGPEFHRLVIDRSFVCEDGRRWIVDYKTSTHEGTDLDRFLLEETERYRPKLRQYRDAVARLEDRPIRTALYFPLLNAFREIDLDA